MNYLKQLFFNTVFNTFLPLLFINSISLAQTIQVPENCINKISPCLVRTEDNLFRFSQAGLQVVMYKEAILKIMFDEKKINFELIEGRVNLMMQKKDQTMLTVNDIPMQSGLLFISRYVDRLDILNLNNYVLSEYSTRSGALSLDLKSTELINKKDFINFTKHYFRSFSRYKRFLAAQAPRWKQEFNKQNNSQTKILLRSIASESEKSKIQAEKSAIVAVQLKKIRDEFFYRTFER